MQSEQINELAGAMVKAQAKFKYAVKGSINPHFRSKYADLASVFEACRKPMAEAGLAVFQLTRVNADGSTVLVTTIAHTSGQWISGEYPIKSVKDDPQSLGAAVTYARRYALAAMVGVAQDDDDGEQATRPKPVATASVTDVTTARSLILNAKSKTDLDAASDFIKKRIEDEATRKTLSTMFVTKQKELGAS